MNEFPVHGSRYSYLLEALQASLLDTLQLQDFENRPEELVPVVKFLEICQVNVEKFFSPRFLMEVVESLNNVPRLREFLVLFHDSLNFRLLVDGLINPDQLETIIRKNALHHQSDQSILTEPYRRLLSNPDLQKEGEHEGGASMLQHNPWLVSLYSLVLMNASQAVFDNFDQNQSTP